jgi:hypothetical protein
LVAQYGYPVGDWPAKNQSVHKHLICTALAAIRNQPTSAPIGGYRVPRVLALVPQSPL